MWFVGDGDFRALGDEFLSYFKDLGHLQPHENVLDIGCGVGRAIPLSEFMTPEGRYEGFDIVKSGIQWCTAHISAIYSNFHFQLSDVYNSYSNPTSRYFAQEYLFPYADQTFDFAFLTSVFTHMLPEAMEHYVAETHRALKTGWRWLLTFLLINPEST